MKDFIKQQLREHLNEVKISLKPVFGQGAEHSVYASNHNPNVLYKIGPKEKVDKWVEVFKSNPKLFPKVYRTGQMKNGMAYAEIEKLDTKDVSNEWYYLSTILEKYSILNLDIDVIDSVFRDVINGHLSLNGILKKLKNEPKAYELFKRWVTALDKINKYTIQSGYRKAGADLHRFNYGYDSAGNIKSFDI